jgi:hypothetical protein
MKKLIFFSLLFQNILHAQLYVGGELSFTSSLSNQSYLDVNPYYLYQINPGFSAMYINKKNAMFKGNVAFVKDRFKDNAANSYLNDYTQFSFQASVLNSQLKNNWHQSLSIGFFVNKLNSYGVAQENELKYTLTEDLGTNLKFGIVSEYSIRCQNSKWLSSITWNAKSDISKLTILSKNDLMIRDNLVQVGIVFNISKKITLIKTK